MKKKILVIATGSVAVIKTGKLIDLLKQKYEVRTIVSDYVLNNFEDVEKLGYESEDPNLNTFPKHIELAKWADLIVVAPASANSISKFVNGIADNFVLTTLLAARSKILFAPAMNTYMYKALVERNTFDKLQSLGHYVIGPNKGMLRELEEGIGRMSEPEEIFDAVNSLLTPSNKKVIISYGASKVYLDPVRYITNGATGSFAKAIQNQLSLKGFDIEMLDASKYTNSEALEYLKNAEMDIYISTAAWADFTTTMQESKIKKGTINSIKLENNIDILSGLRESKPDVFIVGFKYDEVKQNAIDKMNKLNLDLMLWNKIGAMGSQNISGSLISKSGEIDFENMSKNDVAQLIVKEIK